jgi:ATP-binding cassette subfamily F protein 3
MLSLNQVSLRRGDNLLIENATFQVHSGHRLGLIGANGSGKSSLFSMILGELETDEGEVRFPADYSLAHVAQESPNSTKSALNYVIDGDAELRMLQAGIEELEGSPSSAKLHELYEKMETIDGFTAEPRAARLLSGLGFHSDEISNPVQSFSGGWRMRISLARALMCRSDLLLLDEPTNHLDLPAILWLERWLRQYPGILLIISHDRDFLDTVCTRIASIEHLGITLYTGNYSQFEQLRSQQLALQQSMYVRQQKDIKHLQSYVDRFRYKASKARQAQSRLKMLERMTVIAPAHTDSPFRFHFLAPVKQPQHLLGLENVSAGYDRVILKDVSLGITAGDRIGLLGVNGAGKSTLVKALADGSTVLEGERHLSKDTRIGYFAQHQLDQLRPDQSPMAHVRRFDEKSKEQDLRNFLGRFGFSGDRIFDPVEPFSGGEKARLVLALMIQQRPNLLLLDEPTNHLDLEMRQALSVALVEYTGAIVVISHDRHLLRSVCDELLIVDEGKLDVFDGSIDDYPSWLQSRKTDAKSVTDNRPPVETVSRKEQRQIEADKRRRLKPLADKVRAIDKQLAEHRMSLEMLEKQLSDESLYSDPARKEELSALVKTQGETRASLEALEWDWLTASERLEHAESEDLK